MTEELQIKYDTLKTYLEELNSVAVAFSGGVDSTLLMKVAHDTLGDRAIAVTARSAFFPARECRESEDFCAGEGIRQIEVTADVLAIDGIDHNPRNRCYLCKKALFRKMIDTAHGENCIYVVEGSNMDDLGDYRPGLMAIAELDIKSPLRYAHLTKAEIRELSEFLRLPTFNKPSFACLASRFVYGESITLSKLEMVDKAEQLLLDLGLTQERVRIHGDSDYIARIEVQAEDFAKILSSRDRIDAVFKSIGFRYVTLDLTGYRTGAMNEVLTPAERNAALPKD